MSKRRDLALGGLAIVVLALITAGVLSGSGAPKATAVPSSGASPIATDPAIVAPSATARASADPSPTLAASPLAGPCSTLQARIDAAPIGAVLDLAGCTYQEGAIVDKPLTIRGATIRSRAGTDGLHVTADDVTLEGLTIIGPQDRVFDLEEHGIHIEGRPSDPVDGVTIRDSELSSFGYGGIMADHVSGLVVTGNDISDCVYAGIMVLSSRDGRIADNTVARIGLYGTSANSGNAYGIALSNEAGRSRTTGFVVDGNTVTDVPTWHALDTHGGIGISFTDNTVRRSSRALFLTSGARDITVTGNLFDSPDPVTYNLLAVTTAGTTNVTITGNTAKGWGNKVFEDHDGQSSGLVVRDNLPAAIWPTLP